jgi:hypothetical protein
MVEEGDDGQEGRVPDSVEREDVAVEASGPDGGNCEEGTAETEKHVTGEGGDSPRANKKSVELFNQKSSPAVARAMPSWRAKRPNLVGSRVRALLEDNFDLSTEAFESIDVNCDGRISVRELRMALAILDSSQDFKDEELMRVISIADYDGSGTVDLQEFMMAFGPHPLVKQEVQDGLHNIGKTADGRKLAYLSLSISNLNISDVVLLNDFAHLRYLNLSNNMLTELSTLGCLPYLLTLDASNNRLTSVLDFKPPLCLREAYLSKNRITAINSIAHHRFLQILDLSDNRIRVILTSEADRQTDTT